MQKLGLWIIVAALGGMLTAQAARAEDAKTDSGPTFTFGASTSFVKDFNSPNNGPGLNQYTYANLGQDDQFNIDLVQLGISGERGNASYGATVDWGDLAAYVGTSSSSNAALETAWLSYKFGSASATAGRFGTPIGYEVLEPWGDAQISRSWAWQAQPINHDGLKVQGELGPVAWMVGLVNAFTVADPANNNVNGEPGVIASAGWTPSDLVGVYVAGIYSDQNSDDTRTMLNTIVSGKIPLGEAGLKYAVEGNWRQDDFDNGGPTEDFWNVTGYLGSSLGPVLLSGRLDYSDDQSIVSGADTSIWSLSLTAGYELAEGLIARIEYRHDGADDDIFNSNDSQVDTLNTLQAQIMWVPAI